MARIAGVELPKEKRLDVALTYIFGIGPVNSKQVIEKLHLDPSVRSKNLTSDQINLLQKEIENIPVEGELRKIVNENIQILKRIQSYRGLRHTMRLPARGQRTRTNARTLKGKRKTVGAMTKDAREKLAPATETKK